MPALRVTLATLLLAALPAAAQTPSELAGEVRAAETAFAATMAARDFTAFASFIADEAVFFGNAGPLRGKTAVLDGWKGYYDGAAAPFSWAPEVVEVLASGTLALSSGPVLDETGKLIGTFNSIWRRDADGHWRVIFDKGCPPPSTAPAGAVTK